MAPEYGLRPLVRRLLGRAWGVVRTRLAMREARASRRLAEAWDGIEGTDAAVEIRLIGGGRLRLYGDSVLGEYICKSRFEVDEIRFVKRYLQPGDVFVDIGANIGLFTVVAALRVGSRGRVLSLEPGRLARERLLENVELNGLDNVDVFGWALSDTEGSMPLAVPGLGYDAFASLAKPIVDHESASELVETRTWDEIASSLPPAASAVMMKIDIEGWESRALAGATDRLRRPAAPLLQVEFAEEAARNAGSSCESLYRQIESFGYQLCRFDASRGLLVPEAPGAVYTYANLYGTKRLDADNDRLSSSAGRWEALAAGARDSVARVA